MDNKKKSNVWKYAASALLGAAAMYALTGIEVVEIPESQNRAVKQEKRRKVLEKESNLEGIVSPLPELTAENIETIYERNTVIDIWAPWCGPCIDYSIPFAKAAEKYKGKEIYFAKMNLDDNRGTINGLLRDGIFSENVTTIPCTVFIRNGREIDRFVGGNVQKLEEKIDRYYLNENKD